MPEEEEYNAQTAGTADATEIDKLKAMLASRDKQIADLKTTAKPGIKRDAKGVERELPPECENCGKRHGGKCWKGVDLKKELKEIQAAIEKKEAIEKKIQGRRANSAK
eukprot:2943974-Rhodomonas_salina.1